MASIAVVFLLLPILLLVEGGQQKHFPQIDSSSTISPQSDRTSWSSPSGQFQFGFYEQDNGFAIGIWLVGNHSNTVVWTANRDGPPFTSNVTLSLVAIGKLLLKNENKQSWTSALMLDSGNFVLYNKQSQKIWESFQHPTDTLLGGQVLYNGTQLFSSVSEIDRSTGRFHLKMQNDGNLVLYPANNEDTYVDAYWSTDTVSKDGLKYHLYLNTTGVLAIVNDTSQIVSTIYDDSSSDNNGNEKLKIYRAILDANGIFSLYSHAHDDNGTLAKDPVWSALKNPCEAKGFCGLNSYCTFIDSQPNCMCIPGSDFADLNKKTLGCLRNYTDGGCVGDGKENTTLYGMYEMENILWDDIPYNNIQLSISMEECNKSCFEDCNCGAALCKKHDQGENFDCLKQRLPLRYIRRSNKFVDDSDSVFTTAFFKVGKSSVASGSSNQTEETNMLPSSGASNKIFSMEILVLALGLVVFSCVSIGISCLYIFKIRVLRYQRLRDIKGQFGFSSDDHQELITLRVFSHNELKRATNGFKQELGRGSFGAVYKGALNKGRKLIAVKRLEKLIEEGEREFQAEMRAIGRTNHKNLVRLIGYCAEGSKRLLVYEYMSNGSLADLLFNKQVLKRPYWDERVRVAIDVAKGIHYLHEECKSPIIHCDVKPQNILMDDFWTAKISDFGLAKLLMPDQTRTFTGVRGTRGYLAPEWQQNNPITVKADVYSYGIVLLEIICCRRNLEVNVPNAEEIILSNWVYKCFAGRELDKLVVGEDVDRRTLEKMVKVGLWCIQDEAVLRPSMKSVVLMLEGITDISAPPCPTSASM